MAGTAQTLFDFHASLSLAPGLSSHSTTTGRTWSLVMNDATSDDEAVPPCPYRLPLALMRNPIAVRLNAARLTSPYIRRTMIGLGVLDSLWPFPFLFLPSHLSNPLPLPRSSSIPRYRVRSVLWPTNSQMVSPPHSYCPCEGRFHHHTSAVLAGKGSEANIFRPSQGQPLHSSIFLGWA